MMGVNNLTYSKTGLHLTEQFEGCRTSAYQDVRGVWTIGYGHTGPDVHNGLAISLDQAEELLLGDVSDAASCVNEAVLVALQQDEFDALVDFAFNCGTTALRGSTLLVDLNAGDFAKAADQFLGWDRCDGNVVAGLLRRRMAEQALFTSAIPAPEVAGPAKPGGA
jgi:lysozyme